MRGIQAKCVVLGSKGVGKTSLLIKYVKNTQHKDVGTATIASLFSHKVTVDNVRVELQIWDTAGQERFKAVAPMYYRNTNAAILVFDLSQHQTFTALKRWLHELHRNVQDPLILILVGNKLDVSVQRTVTRDEANQFAAVIGARYFETCMEADQGLEQVFMTIALGVIRMLNEGKSHSLRSFESCESISAYTNNNTAVSFSTAALVQNGSGAFQLSKIPIGIPVEGENVLTNGVGYVERPAWSIDHIALGEAERVGWCCY